MRTRIMQLPLRRQFDQLKFVGEDVSERMRLLPRSLSAALYRTPLTMAGHSTQAGTANQPPPFFQPKKVLILSKITRYEFEKKFHREVKEETKLEALRESGVATCPRSPSCDPLSYRWLNSMSMTSTLLQYTRSPLAMCQFQQLRFSGATASPRTNRAVSFVSRPEKYLEYQANLRRRGSDYNRLLIKHKIHNEYLDTIVRELSAAGIESRVVQRFDYDEHAVEWADAVVTAGGDGTFLLAASKIKDRTKPVIGINTDPQGSEGYMCLMRKLPKEHFRSALHRLLSGDFQWLLRQRIRITVTSDRPLESPVELHDQQLNRAPSTTRWQDNPREAPIVCRSRRQENGDKVEMITQQLPVLALNEVFVGESLSSRVSYYELQVNGGKMVKQKSSGITVCTGTGSTSWYFNINKLTEQCVKDLVELLEEQCGVKIPRDDPKLLEDICTRFNQKLIFSPDHPKLAFAIRDPVFNATFPPTAPRGFAEEIRVKSRGYDAHLVVDGGVSYHFNDGAEAVMRVSEDDALLTVVFR